MPVPTVAEPLRHRLRVRYGECDPQGIVFNANYLAYLDQTFTELLRAAYGRPNATVQRAGSESPSPNRSSRQKRRRIETPRTSRR